MHANKTVDVHRFSMIPRADIPRSSFKIEHSHKTTFDAGYLVPIYVEEVLPGDQFKLNMTAFGRLATPLYPIMDNLHLNTFFFFVPYRLVWSNFVKMMGEQDDPGDSTDYLVPTVTSGLGGFVPGEIHDHFGLPTQGQVDPAQTITVSALPFRAYNLIWNEWFRDENLQDRLTVNKNDGPDSNSIYGLVRRGKRHDYFTSCLPWPQKGEPVSLPIGGATAPVVSNSQNPSITSQGFTDTLAVSPSSGDTGRWMNVANENLGGAFTWAESGLVADLSAATAQTINSIRTSFQIQKLLERDARGGTRYTELIRSHFGVTSPDARLQRPEYLGGGHTPININPVAQTSGSPPAADGYTDTPLGNLAAMGTMLGSGHGFRQAFTEHGVIIGLACVTADLTYQQGIRRMWQRRTRYDHYFPAFAHLGEQAVLNREIYATGNQTQDDAVFGYQERWAEYRYAPSMITGLFRSTTANTIDGWHLAQHFTALPTLNTTFIQETPPVERILAVGAGAFAQQIIMDALFTVHAARPLPMYSVPGLMDHF